MTKNKSNYNHIQSTVFMALEEKKRPKPLHINPKTMTRVRVKAATRSLNREGRIVQAALAMDCIRS
jgi:hypothetical protein